MIDCDALEDLITPHVDGEGSPEARAHVTAHLRGCPRCRARVEAEATARRVLRAHAGVARTSGVAPSWRPRVSRLGQPALVVTHPAAVVLAVAVALVVAALALRPRRVEAVGFIGDSVCGLHHRLAEAFHVDERTCTVNCVKFGGGTFVLVADGKVYAIVNQDFRGLADFAGARVAVSGTPSGDDTIIVSRIASATH
jgi:hypothetical protein